MWPDMLGIFRRAVGARHGTVLKDFIIIIIIIVYMHPLPESYKLKTKIDFLIIRP